MKDRDIVVDELYKLYQSKGFVTDDEIFLASEKYNLSFFDTDYITNKIFDLGVLVSDAPIKKVQKQDVENADKDEQLTDFAQLDYEVIYYYFDENYPGMKTIVELARTTQPIQHGEMLELITQIRSGNKYAKEIAFNKYIRLALKSAYNYRKKTTIPSDDIFQEACIGIFKALDSYDPYQNSAFTSYCSSWIKQTIDRYIDDNERLIRVPVHTLDNVRKLKETREKLFCQLQLEPSYKDIADSMDIAVKYLQELLYLEEEEILSLDEPIDEEDNYLDDIIQDENELPVFDTVAFNMLREEIELVLSSLKTKQKEIIKLRFGFYNGQECTLEEVAREFNLTRERIRQIIAKTLRQLRRPKLCKRLKDYLY